MIRANIADVKAHFSSYVRRVRAGEIVVIERNVPVAELKQIVPEERLRRAEPGSMKGAVLWVADDAFDPMSDDEIDEIESNPIFPVEELRWTCSSTPQPF
jgi:antitoxin (DNA-binding transcriptional repressor) of toxin-antitoxin stability system